MHDYRLRLLLLGQCLWSYRGRLLGCGGSRRWLVVMRWLRLLVDWAVDSDVNLVQPDARVMG